MNKETIELLRSVATALAVFVPLVVFWLQKKDKLQKTKYFIELMRAHDDLTALRARPQADELNEKIDHLLHEVDEEIHYSFDPFGLHFFMLIVFVEVTVLATLVSQGSEYINLIFSGPSYESGLYFLEGIFQSTTSRLILLMITVSLSVFITIQTTKKWREKFTRALKRNLVLLAVFHVILVLVIIVLSLVLSLLDPIIPFW